MYTTRSEKSRHSTTKMISFWRDMCSDTRETYGFIYLKYLNGSILRLDDCVFTYTEGGSHFFSRHRRRRSIRVRTFGNPLAARPQRQAFFSLFSFLGGPNPLNRISDGVTFNEKIRQRHPIRHWLTDLLTNNKATVSWIFFLFRFLDEFL